jgi:polyhydroxyalkanoate synthesis repressor PhaR
MTEEAVKKDPSQKEPIIVKKYANRRLYNTESSSYVTLDDLCTLVKKGSDFVVYDAKTGEDITRQILTQVIFEQESKGVNLLPVNFLRWIIGFYDNSMRDMVPPYLEASMKTFTQNQEKMREYMESTMGGFFPGFSQLEELGKQNMALFQQAMNMFNPFSTLDKKPEDKK